LGFQVIGLDGSQLEHEIGGESAQTSAYGPIDDACFDPVEGRKIRVQHHPLTADDMDPRPDARGDRFGRHSDVIGEPLLA
jgi:hypothetical protein